LSIQPAASVYVAVSKMSMIWWFSASATVVTKSAWFFQESLMNEVPSSLGLSA
jgi:hypothetical protein